MKSIQLSALPLMEAWFENDAAAKWKANLPFTPAFPLWSGIQPESLSAVYMEMEPGQMLGQHTDSAEELVVVLSGTAEAAIGGSTAEFSAGSLFIIPAMEPHSIRNIGSDTLKCLGVFSSTQVTSSFSEIVQPLGIKVLNPLVEA